MTIFKGSLGRISCTFVEEVFQLNLGSLWLCISYQSHTKNVFPTESYYVWRADPAKIDNKIGINKWLDNVPNSVS